MYLDFLVKIPFVQGKITRRKKKGMKDFIRGIIEENQGGFENSRGKYVDRYDVYGMIVKRFLCEGDTKKRNFHIYYSDGKAYSKKEEIKPWMKRLNADKHSPASSARSTKRRVRGMLLSVGVESSH